MSDSTKTGSSRTRGSAVEVSDAPEEWVALGNRLKEMRDYLNLSQQHVASVTGIPRSAVSDIERGHRKVDSLELRKFARLYHCSVGRLLGEPVLEDEDVDPTTALGRAIAGLGDGDKAELIRFAEYLKFNARARGSDSSQ